MNVHSPQVTSSSLSSNHENGNCEKILLFPANNERDDSSDSHQQQHMMTAATPKAITTTTTTTNGPSDDSDEHEMNHIFSFTSLQTPNTPNTPPEIDNDADEGEDDNDGEIATGESKGKMLSEQEQEEERTDTSIISPSSTPTTTTTTTTTAGRRIMKFRPSDALTVGHGLFIQQSNIENAGLGLFTSVLLFKNQCVTQYEGPVLTYKQARRLNKFSHTRSLDSQHSVIQGIDDPVLIQGKGGASFANDARGSVMKNNTMFKKHYMFNGQTRIYLKVCSIVLVNSRLDFCFNFTHTHICFYVLCHLCFVVDVMHVTGTERY